MKLEDLNHILKDFVSDNQKNLLQYIFFVLTYYPIEIFLYSYLFGIFFNNIALKKKKEDLYKLIFLIVMLFAISNIFRIMKLKYEKKLIPDFLKYFRKNMFENILNSLNRNYKETNIGKILTSFINIPNSFNILIYNMFGIMVPKFFSTLFILIFIFSFNFKVGFISLGFFIFYILLCSKMYSDCSKICLQKIKQFEKTNKEIEDVLKNSISVLLSSNMKNEVDNINHFEDLYKKKYFTSLNCCMKYNIIFGFGIIIYLGIILYITTNLNISTSSKITIFIFTSYLTSMYILIFDLLPNVIHEAVFTNNALKLFKNLEFETDKKKVKLDGSVNLQDLRFKYKDKYLFYDLNLNLKPNDKIIITGKSGTGKSSLLKLILGFYKLNSGRIKYNNTKLLNHDINHFRKQVSFCDQYPRLFDNSVLYNIAYSTNIKDKEIIDIIKKYKINNLQKIINLPSIGINGYKISGGQRQMINILKCFIQNSKIVFMDEPSASLDDYHFNILRRLINDNNNRTYIIISHDQRIISLQNFKKYKLINQKLINLNQTSQKKNIKRRLNRSSFKYPS